MKKQSDHGYLKLHITQSGSHMPVTDAKIRIAGTDIEARSDKNGIICLKLPSVPPVNSLIPGNGDTCSVYSYTVSAPLFHPCAIFGEDIFPNVTTKRNIALKSAAMFPEEHGSVIIVPDTYSHLTPPQLNEHITVAEIVRDIIPSQVVIPESITVHLGAPNADAPNVEVPFIEYIQSVASSEIYPTWPENALRANILAQITLALNRIYTEWYRSQGYDFDITSSTAYDQSYVFERSTYEETDTIVKELFNSYISRTGNIEPIFPRYCDGLTVSCDGMSQWGTVSLARMGYSPLDILKYYYGDNIEIREAPVQEFVSGSYPGSPLYPGDKNDSVWLLQARLNRISIDYPDMPFIVLPDGTYNAETEAAVRYFQRLFGLDVTGVTDKNTWNKIVYIYNAVKKLAELNSEGEREESDTFPGETLSKGARGIAVLRMQWYLNRIIASLQLDVHETPTGGIYNDLTERTVREFQKAIGLEPTGNIDETTWNRIVGLFYSVLDEVPEEQIKARPYPGAALRRGSVGENVIFLQNALNAVGRELGGIDDLIPDGIFGPKTEEAVKQFQSSTSLTPDGIVGAKTWNKLNETLLSVDPDALG